MTEETAHFTSTDPAEIHSTPPYRPTREQTLKTVQDKWPGHITIASDRASFSGCRIITFFSGGWTGLTPEDNDAFESQVFARVDELEALHTAAINSLPPEMKTIQDLDDSDLMLTPAELMNLYFSTRANLLVLDWKINNEGAITVIVTTQLDAEDLEEMQEVNVRVNLEMREWREKRAKEKAERQAEAMEERRLIEVGRTAETYNLAGRVRELETELAEARKAAKP